MKRTALLLALIFIPAINSIAQKSITFDVEELCRADKPLPVQPYNSILERLIGLDDGYPDLNPISVPYNIVAKSNIPDKLVGFGYSSFFRGMYTAYAEHRPFTLSPDMMWLLISQGFANHVNNNADELRSMLVNFKGKATLSVQNSKIRLDDPNSPWEEVFPEFTNQIARYTGPQLTNALTADFSTTTPITKVASQITIMNAMHTFFYYKVFMGCGIPQVTLEGTPADWQRVLDKAEALRKYKLDWWIDAIEPPLKQFIAASKGNIDKTFWQGMFKYHVADGHCAPGTIIDGWIVKFYPYNHKGKRNDLLQVIKSIGGDDQMPDEIVKVNLDYYNDKGQKAPLELWAGFVGLEQNDKTFGLKPRIGWMVRKQESNRQSIITLYKKQNQYMGGVALVMDSIPYEIMQIGPIKSLSLFFNGHVKIPAELAKVQIGELWINGEIYPPETEQIIKLFPHTKVVFTTNNNPIRNEFSDS